MANVKISELNETTTVSNNDLLVIVDVANNETKKVKAQYVGGNIPIQNTAPSNPEQDDLWIDTSEGTGTSIIDLIFPIGSIIIKDDNTDYSNWLGYTWQKVFAGRVLVGQDTTQTEFDTIGETGGSKTHTLTTEEMPSHSHNVQPCSNAGGGGANYPPSGNWTTNPTVLNWQTSSNGGDQAHNNLQPYQVVAYWKRVS